MLRKEFNEASKQALLVVGFVVFGMLLILFLSLLFEWEVPFGELLLSPFQLGLLVTGLVSGLSLFSAETRQGGVEYLLTLPFSRYRLLLMKLFPRLVVLLLVYLVYILLSLLFGSTGLAAALPGLPNAMLLYGVLSLFLIGVSLSISHHNFVFLSLVAVFIALVHFFFLYGLFHLLWLELFNRYLYYSPSGAMTVGMVVVLLPLFISFVVSFKRFDVRFPRGFNKRFGKLLVPLFAVGLLLAAIFTYSIGESWHKYYHLTRDHRALLEEGDALRVYDEEGLHKLESARWGYFFTLFERGDFLYGRYSSKEGRGLFRLDKRSYRMEPIYNEPGFLSSIHPRIYKDTLAFFKSVNRYSQKMVPHTLVLLNLDTLETKEIRLAEKLPPFYFGFSLFGADEIDGKRFWLIRSNKPRRYPLVRVWEDGRTEELCLSNTSPGYFNGLLITSDREGMVFSRLTATGMNVVKKIAAGKGLRLLSSRLWSLDSRAIKTLYANFTAKEGIGTIYRIDLESLEVTPAAEWDGFVRPIDADHALCHTYAHDDRGTAYLLKIGLLKGSKIEVLKEFRLKDRVQERGMSPAGIVLDEKGKLKVYALPEFKELTFKGLH